MYVWSNVATLNSHGRTRSRVDFVPFFFFYLNALKNWVSARNLKSATTSGNAHIAKQLQSTWSDPVLKRKFFYWDLFETFDADQTNESLGSLQNSWTYEMATISILIVVCSFAAVVAEVIIVKISYLIWFVFKFKFLNAKNTKVTAGSAQFPVSKGEGGPFQFILNPISILKFPQVCREKFSTAASGSIQPFTSPNSNDNGNKECSFILEAPADQLILISCSIVNLTSPGSELIVSRIKLQFNISNFIKCLFFS